ncbi:UDP-N-acetylglucosamine 2-epimerase [Sediminibacterium sp.]|uniref:UDP-N-acetylglucosamine 2-epimerase n=1 Tax=Sediminibacterium sp. TaxID=1917865 RepID=UPI0025CC1038|nr:UDP-N-acetylglucosamine 2-epimerase [Sediminibacterium sp.]
MIRIGVLTSSRADFGIYLPLLKSLEKDHHFELNLIVFGTHNSRFHGYTRNEILGYGFNINYSIDSILLSDTPEANATSTALSALKFSSFWGEHYAEFDMVLCLGDRFEMFAAVMSGIPFGIKFAHIHGGETTLGAIDNIYRHSISLASCMHFTATERFANRVSSLIETKQNVFSVGSLSLENLLEIKLLTKEAFFEKWGIDMSIPTVLVTFHPETVEFQNVKNQAEIIVNSLNEISEHYQLLITMPNADTSGSIVRDIFGMHLSNKPNIKMIENLGTISYFSAMKHCYFVFGNSSSGIIEAASFGKYVINIGDRQKGRATSDNILQCSYNLENIKYSVSKIIDRNYQYLGENIYKKDHVVSSIINQIKIYFGV